MTLFGLADKEWAIISPLLPHKPARCAADG